MYSEFDDLLATGSPLPGLPADPPGVAVTITNTPGGERAFGAFEGAARLDATIANWAPRLSSADQDIIPDKPVADARARDLMRNDAYVQGGAQLHRDNIVGSQFILNAKPATKVLFGKADDDWEAEFQEEVEELFDLAAESPDNLFDASGVNTFTGLIRLATGIHVSAGEVLATVEWKKDGRPFNTAIQMVDLDRLQTPPLMMKDSQVRAGVKRDRYGKPESYFIRKTHPNDYLPFFSFTDMLDQYVEVAATKPWGRRQVIHLFEQQRADQTRGIAAMVSALKEMHITKRFRDVTLQNAVTQALYAASITSDMPTEAIMQTLGGQTDADAFQRAFTEYTVGYMQTVDQFAGASRNLKADGVRIPHLLPGTKLDLLKPGNGGPLGMEFEQSLLRYIAATLGVSYEQLSRDYTQTNYSSARAAMTETWKFMQAQKKIIADRLATIIFRLWLEEMVNANALATFPKSKAVDLYTSGRLNLKFDALARCDWIGAARGQIDELKETQADVLKLNNGLTTREAVIAKQGGDWRKVLRQLAREKQTADGLGLVFAAADPSMMNAVDGGGQPTNSPNPDGATV